MSIGNVVASSPSDVTESTTSMVDEEGVSSGGADGKESEFDLKGKSMEIGSSKSVRVELVAVLDMNDNEDGRSGIGCSKGQLSTGVINEGPRNVFGPR